MNQVSTELPETPGARDTSNVVRPLEVLHRTAGQIDTFARHALRFSLVIVIGWIGAMKFTSYEAEGISGFVENSPLMGWTYAVFSHQQLSTLLGIVELAIAALIAAGLKWPRIGAIGATAAVGMFLTTLSFMLTTPGVAEPAAGGFPAISAMPGQFLIKDAALLAVALRLFADGLRHGLR